jgi:hypothetical protein
MLAGTGTYYTLTRRNSECKERQNARKEIPGRVDMSIHME